MLLQEHDKIIRETQITDSKIQELESDSKAKGDQLLKQDVELKEA